MQKLINVLAVASAVVSLTVVGTAGYVYVRKDAIIESIKEKAMGSIMPAVPSIPSVGEGGATDIIPSVPMPF
jgi:hypothetical protein